MNKKSNFTRTVLLSALLCGIAGPSFVGCKDYDDDIDALQAQIDENKDAIAALEQQISGGAIVTKVESDGNGGVVITLSDGTTHTITKGDKGDDGTSAPTPIFQISNGILQVRYSTEEAWQDLGKVTPDAEALEFTIDEATGELMLNGESLGKVVGEAGKPLAVDFRISDTGMLEYLNQEGKWVEIGQVTGANGATPKLQFKLENGQLMYQDANAIESEWVAVDGFNMNDILTNYMTLSVDENGMLCVGGEPTDVQVNYEIYLVEKDGAMMLHLPYKNTEGVWVYRDITLPTTDIFSKMITSATFVPMVGEGNDLTMYKLKAEVGTPAKEYLASSSVLRFRVSPNTAVYGTDYTIAESMDYFLTRASQETPLFSAVYNKELTEENKDGLVYVNFNFDQTKVDMDKTYTLALALNDMHNEGRMVYSDYIKFKPSADNLNSAWKVVGNENLEDPNVDGETVQVLRQKGSMVDVTNLLVYAGSEPNTNEWATLDKFGFDNVTYKFEFGEDASDLQKTFISINGSVITVLDDTYQVTQNNGIPVKVSAMIGNDVLAVYDFKVNIVDELTPDPTVVNLSIVNNISVSNTGVDVNDIPLVLVKDGLNELNSVWDIDMSQEEFTFEVADANGAVTGFSAEGDFGKGIKVSIESDVEVGTYSAKLVFKNEELNGTINVLFTITVTQPEIVYAANGRWDANHTTLGVRINKEGGYVTDLNTAFVCEEGRTKMTFRIDETEIEGMEFNANGTITVKSFDELPTEIWENGVTVYYQLMGGTDYSVALSDERSCVVKFTNPIGTLSSAVNTLSIMDGANKEIPFETELGLSLRGYDPILSETVDLIVEGLDSEEDNYTVTFEYVVSDEFKEIGNIEYDDIKEAWMWVAKEKLESATDVPVVLTVTVDFVDEEGTSKAISKQELNITLHIEPETTL